uniref:E3 ubiquitin-protein ligase Topors n=1 Tax=Amblyomma triste TaxID=251400 RepID=A0A023G766_AMBTT
MATSEVEVVTPSAYSGSSGSDGVASTAGVKSEPAKGDSGAEPSSTRRPSSAKSPERPSSPEQSCAICLGPPENKSFTDSCFHTFCFSCLLEWSKVKAECPLCKQRFKSIVHNVRSFEDYDRYFVSSNGQSSSSSTSATGGAARVSAASALSNALLLAHHLVYSPMLITWHSTPRRRSVLSFSATRSRSSSRSSRARSNHAAVMRAAAAASTVATGPLPTSSTERRSLYELDLWVCPPNNRRSARRFTPAFFRENQACTHRLIPWLNRELLALLGNGGEAQLAFTTELVLALVTRYEVCSLEFAEHVRPFFGERTAHFLHELAAFVCSPLDMVAYDRVAVYDARANVIARGASPAAQFLQPPALEDDDNSVGLAPVERAPVTLGPLARDPSQPGPSGLHHNTMVDLVASESDDSDCMIVTSVLPMQSRTPVVIELSSDDDHEQGLATSTAVAAPAAGAVPALAPTPAPLPQLPVSRRKPVARKRMSVFWSSDSDSSTQSDSDYEDTDAVATPAHRRCIGPSGMGMHRKRLRMLARSPATAMRTNGVSTRLSAAALDQPSSSSGHRQSVVQRKRTRRPAQRMVFSSDED